jgi:hypothetical protein
MKWLKLQMDLGLHKAAFGFEYLGLIVRLTFFCKTSLCLTEGVEGALNGYSKGVSWSAFKRPKE